jgi:hypothetical protein
MSSSLLFLAHRLFLAWRPSCCWRLLLLLAFLLFTASLWFLLISFFCHWHGVPPLLASLLLLTSLLWLSYLLFLASMLLLDPLPLLAFPAFAIVPAADVFHAVVFHDVFHVVIENQRVNKSFSNIYCTRPCPLGYSDYDVFLENYRGSWVYRCKKQF